MSQKKFRDYPMAFKQEALNLLEASDRSAADIERELGINQGQLTRWRRQQEKRRSKQKEGSATAAAGVKESVEMQLKRLQRENAQLREEKAILKKAIAIFSGQSR